MEWGTQNVIWMSSAVTFPEPQEQGEHRDEEADQPLCDALPLFYSANSSADYWNFRFYQRSIYFL